MKRELRFLPEVRSDFFTAFTYYRSLAPRQGGERFEAAFRVALREVSDGFVTHFMVFGSFHRVIIRKYPYNLYYRLVEGGAVVVGVLYARFDPKKIEAMLKSRTDST